LTVRIAEVALCDGCGNDSFKLQKRGESPLLWLLCAGCDKPVATLGHTPRLSQEHSQLIWRPGDAT